LIRVAALVGPTAAGKTVVAVEVAERLNAEIVSVDSMQIYRSLDCGTAKPGPDLRRRVRHHLLDLRPPSHRLTVAEYRELGRASIDDIASRGKLPFLVGGSGLYWRAIVDDLDFPPEAPEVRARLEAQAMELGAPALHDRLSELDPVAAEKIEPGNLRRTVRALEVIEITGRRFSEFGVAWDRYESRYALTAAGLARARSDLYDRIARRADQMIAAGLVEEASRLAAGGLSATARQALGYKQVLEAPAGATLDDIRAAVVRATKRYARRQESWFRADPRIVWFDASAADVVDQVVSHLGPPA
jgi:tRNA dimethylallyltransferase